MNVRYKLLGGLLLKDLAYRLFDVDNSVVNSVVTRNGSGNTSNTLNKTMKNRMKDEVIKLFTTGQWRSDLGPSMKLANDVLDYIIKGLENVYSSSRNSIVIDLKLVLLDKGLVGTGSGIVKSLVEVGLNIDWLLGLPYYPGSTLKGATRAILDDVDCDSAMLLFGSSSGSRSRSCSEGSDSMKDNKDNGAHMGYMFVSDAYPVGCYRGSMHPCLVYTGDVVTPHYFRPGRGIVEKARPTPIVHVAIAPGTVFRVVVGVRKPPDEHLNRLLRAGRELGFLRDNEARGVYGLGLFIARLLGAAMMTGFAARSGKGYNVFKPLSDEEARSLSYEVVSLEIRQQSKRHSGRQKRDRGDRGQQPRGGHRGKNRSRRS